MIFCPGLDPKLHTASSSYKIYLLFNRTELWAICLSMFTLELPNLIASKQLILIITLYKLSVNEKLKMDVFNYPDLKNTLKSLIFDAIEVEKNYGLELFSQLAFNKQVNEELNKDLDLIEYVTKLQNKKDFEFKLLEKTCQNFLWILKSKEKQVENLPLIKTSHIMISYNTASRVKCLKIKDELEKLNFKIWIDVNEIHGSSLDSMAQAVEQSQIVLICITEKYRQSVNCQAEAQYAFKLNKPIVPLIMQAGYNKVSNGRTRS